MSDEHVDKKPVPAIDPAVWEQPDVRAVLAARDIGALYRALTEAGLSQYRIARLTGQSQPEVSEIIGGRRVIAYEVLERIAEGLGVPRELVCPGGVPPVPALGGTAPTLERSSPTPLRG